MGSDSRVNNYWIFSVKTAIGIGLIISVLAVPGVVFAGVAKPMVGKDDYKNFCAACHGIGGRGDGPVSGHLKNNPVDLTLLAKNNDGQFPKKYVTQVVQGNKDYDKNYRTHGPVGMPVWGRIFYEDSGDKTSIAKIRINNIVRYIESLQE